VPSASSSLRLRQQASPPARLPSRLRWRRSRWAGQGSARARARPSGRRGAARRAAARTRRPRSGVAPGCRRLLFVSPTDHASAARDEQRRRLKTAVGAGWPQISTLPTRSRRNRGRRRRPGLRERHPQAFVHGCASCQSANGRPPPPSRRRRKGVGPADSRRRPHRRRCPRGWAHPNVASVSPPARARAPAARPRRRSRSPARRASPQAE
jgi:hypothetical protein